LPRDGRVRIWIQFDWWRRVCQESGEILRAILVAIAVIAETRGIAGIVVIAGFYAQIVDRGVARDEENNLHTRQAFRKLLEDVQADRRPRRLRSPH